MSEISIIGVDLAKNVFQLHGAYTDGSVAFRKKLSRAQFLPFLAQQKRCLVAMESCATSHNWAREIKLLEAEHDVKLIPPQYVKPYVKRQKNDAADAEAIAEAVSRPTMRFVEVKSTKQQNRAMLFRTRNLWVKQRTQMVNALRGHLAEYGVIGPKSKAGLKKLKSVLNGNTGELTELVVDIAHMYFEHIDQLSCRILVLDKKIASEAKSSDFIRRLMTIPGVGMQTALAVEAFAPDMSCFKCGRDFAAWLGVVPKQHSSGGKDRLGKTSKGGQEDIRRLLINGAMSVMIAASRTGAKTNTWLQNIMLRKPKLVVAITLANKMARTIWALLTKNEDYRNFELKV